MPTKTLGAAEFFDDDSDREAAQLLDSVFGPSGPNVPTHPPSIEQVQQAARFAGGIARSTFPLPPTNHN